MKLHMKTKRSTLALLDIIIIIIIIRYILHIWLSRNSEETFPLSKMYLVTKDGPWMEVVQE